MNNHKAFTINLNEIIDEETKLHIDQFITLNRIIERNHFDYLTSREFKPIQKAESEIDGVHKLIKRLTFFISLTLEYTKKLKRVRFLNKKSIIYFRALEAIRIAKEVKSSPDNKMYLIKFPEDNTSIRAPFSISWNKKLKIKLFNKTLLVDIDPEFLDHFKNSNKNICTISNSNYNYSISI